MHGSLVTVQVENWKRKAVETCSSSNQLLAAGQCAYNTCLNVQLLVEANSEPG